MSVATSEPSAPATIEVRGEAGSPWADATGLTWVLARKNFQVRYKRAILGVLWAVVQPTFYALVLWLVFTRLVALDLSGEQDAPYLLFVLSGTIPWAFFTQSLSAATTSIVDNGPLIKKVALPRLVFTLAAVGGVAIAFAASLVILLVASGLAGTLSLRLALLPLAVLLQLVLVTGLGALTSSLHVAFRDVRYVVDSVILVGFYATPVFYDVTLLDGVARDLIRLNPMTGILGLYRSAFLGAELDLADVAAAGVVSVAALALGLLLFHRRSPAFADLV